MAASALVPALFFAGSITLDHHRLMAEAEVTADRTVEVAREHALKVVETNRLVLDRMADRIRDLSWPEIEAQADRIHPDVEELDRAIGQISALHVIAPDGKLVVLSRQWPTPEVNLTDRGYFRRLATTSDPEALDFSEPVEGRNSGNLSFHIARRRNAEGGRFDGVFASGLSPAYFDRQWRTLTNGENVHVGLARTDGVVLARHPEVRPGMRLPPQGVLLEAIRQSPRQGRLVVSQAMDGTERLLAYRQVGDFPLLVYSGVSLAAVRSTWLVNTAVTFGICLLAAAALCGATALAARRWRSEQLAQAQLTRAAEELRAEILRREQAEDGLSRAQRLEALGRLTGGVAHDVNNLLTAILGSVHLLERHLGAAADARTRRLLRAARDAVESGARLNAGLLAFARRQPLRPRALDANALIQEFVPLLQRALGETVQLRLELDRALPHCQADAAQLEAALLNLAINARDAMPGGGEAVLTARSARLDPPAAAGPDAPFGDFVAITLRDTGEGMTPEVRERAFEPFFTTKPPGRGTGLGLSQVFGFVRQLGGQVAIDSAPGRGTAVTLYLPLATADAAAAAQDRGGEGTPPACQTVPLLPPAGSTVLLAEDDAQVRAITAEALREAGFRVLAAQDGAEALELLRNSGPVDLLFSDVMMPGGMSGLDLARGAATLQPGIAVLLASGHAAESFAQAAAAGGWELLPKPYDLDDLVRRVTLRLTRARGAVA
jgi:signal transduction histidine kinase/ActR/RegA family two-component response regulator